MTRPSPYISGLLKEHLAAALPDATDAQVDDLLDLAVQAGRRLEDGTTD